MYKNVKCLKCGKKNSLPISIFFGNNGLETKLKPCKNCGVNLTPKEYNKLISEIPCK